MSVLNLIVLGLLWTVTVWRAPSARRSARHRALWSTFALLAVALTFDRPNVARSIDWLTSTPNLALLLVHLAAIAAAAALLHYVALITQASSPRRFAISLAVAATAGAVLTAVWAIPAGHEIDIAATVATHGRATTMVAFYAIFSGYLAYPLTLTAALCWAHAHRSGATAFGRGLRLLAAGCSLGVAYCAERIAYITDPASPADVARASNLTQKTAILLIIAGSSLPAGPALLRAVEAHRGLRRLHSLWQNLAGVVPSIALDTLRGRWADALDLRAVPYRRHRREVEIRDGILLLSTPLPAALREEARRRAHHAGLVGVALHAMTEAICLHLALYHGYRSEGPPPPPTDTGSRLEIDAESRWLEAVAAAFDSPMASTIAAELATTHRHLLDDEDEQAAA